MKGKVCIKGECLFREINVCSLPGVFNIPHLNSHLLPLRYCNVLGVRRHMFQIHFWNSFVENGLVPYHRSIYSNTGGSSIWFEWECRIGSNKAVFVSWDWDWIVRLVGMRMEWVEFFVWWEESVEDKSCRGCRGINGVQVVWWCVNGGQFPVKGSVFFLAVDWLLLVVSVPDHTRFWLNWSWLVGAGRASQSILLVILVPRCLINNSWSFCRNWELGTFDRSI